jgi:hypothetical protein
MFEVELRMNLDDIFKKVCKSRGWRIYKSMDGNPGLFLEYHNGKYRLVKVRADTCNYPLTSYLKYKEMKCYLLGIVMEDDKKEYLKDLKDI